MDHGCQVRPTCLHGAVIQISFLLTDDVGQLYKRLQARLTHSVNRLNVQRDFYSFISVIIATTTIIIIILINIIIIQLYQSMYYICQKEFKGMYCRSPNEKLWQMQCMWHIAVNLKINVWNLCFDKKTHFVVVI